jgi:hypothetical protein
MSPDTGDARTSGLISAVATAYRARADAQTAVAVAAVNGTLTVNQVEVADRARAAFEHAVRELLKASGEVLE